MAGHTTSGGDGGRSVEGVPSGAPSAIPAAAVGRPLRGAADEFEVAAGHEIPFDLHTYVPGMDFMLVIRRKPSEKTAGGIIKADVKEDLTDGLILSAGPDAHYSGFDPIDLIGRRILFGRWCGTMMPVDDDQASRAESARRYIVMRASEDIWGFKDEAAVGSTLLAWTLEAGWKVVNRG